MKVKRLKGEENQQKMRMPKTSAFFYIILTVKSPSFVIFLGNQSFKI